VCVCVCLCVCVRDVYCCIVQLESKVIAQWNVTQLVVYIGVQQRKNPTSR